MLRRLLGDWSRNLRFIETLATLDYRFVSCAILAKQRNLKSVQRDLEMLEAEIESEAFSQNLALFPSDRPPGYMSCLPDEPWKYAAF